MRNLSQNPQEINHLRIAEFLSASHYLDSLEVIYRTICDIHRDRLDERLAQLKKERHGWTLSPGPAKVLGKIGAPRLALMRAQLRADSSRALELPASEAEELLQHIDRLKVFDNIPCSKCGKPLYPPRELVLEIFRRVRHAKC